MQLYKQLVDEQLTQQLSLQQLQQHYQRQQQLAEQQQLADQQQQKQQQQQQELVLLEEQLQNKAAARNSTPPFSAGSSSSSSDQDFPEGGGVYLLPSNSSKSSTRSIGVQYRAQEQGQQQQQGWELGGAATTQQGRFRHPLDEAQAQGKGVRELGGSRPGRAQTFKYDSDPRDSASSSPKHSVHQGHRVHALEHASVTQASIPSAGHIEIPWPVLDTEEQTHGEQEPQHSQAWSPSTPASTAAAAAGAPGGSGPLSHSPPRRPWPFRIYTPRPRPLLFPKTAAHGTAAAAAAVAQAAEGNEGGVGLNSGQAEGTERKTGARGAGGMAVRGSKRKRSAFRNPGEAVLVAVSMQGGAGEGGGGDVAGKPRGERERHFSSSSNSSSSEGVRSRSARGVRADSGVRRKAAGRRHTGSAERVDAFVLPGVSITPTLRRTIICKVRAAHKGNCYVR
eukprot:scaffold11954_cov22-Tisochrysis_lutea.AAC.1